MVEKEDVRKQGRECWENWIPKILSVAKQVPSTSATRLMEDQEDECEGTHTVYNLRVFNINLIDLHSIHKIYLS